MCTRGWCWVIVTVTVSLSTASGVLRLFAIDERTWLLTAANSLESMLGCVMRSQAS